MKTRTLTVPALAVSLALVLSYVDHLIPLSATVPGIRIGLANIVILFVLYRLGARYAAAVSLIRVLLSSVLFGGITAFAYGLAGGALSLTVMALLRRTHRFGVMAVSICGGVLHNCGQILVAILVTNTPAIASYLPVLWISGIAAGAVVGILAALVLHRTRNLPLT